MHARFACGLLALLTLACARCGSGEGARATADVDVVDGEERWSYAAAPANRLPWAFDTLAVIGDLFGDSDAYQFDQVTSAGLAGDDGGDVYLLDRVGKRVLRFRSDGEHVATYGRAGGGPGELEQPIALALGPGDSIWVSDVSNQRITIYPPSDGQPRSIDYPMSLGLAPREIRTLGEEYLHVVEPLRLARRRPAGEPSGEGRPVLARFGAGGEVRDTIWGFRPPRFETAESAEGGGRAVMRIPIGFEPERHWELLSDGTVVFSDAAAYSIGLVASDGTLLRRIERDPPPRETTDADRESERERLAEAMQGGGGIQVTVGGRGGAGGAVGGPPAGGPPGGGSSGMLARLFEEMRFEPVIPRIVDLAVDTSDRIWVGVAVDTPNEVERIDIYAPDGTLIGELHDVPFPDHFFGPGLAAKLVRDELDVQRVLVLRLDEREGE